MIPTAGAQQVEVIKADVKGLALPIPRLKFPFIAPIPQYRMQGRREPPRLSIVVHLPAQTPPRRNPGGTQYDPNTGPCSKRQ